MGIKQKMVSPILMWLLVAAGLALIFRFIKPQMVFSRGSWSYMLLAVAIGYWLYFFVGALKVHRQAARSVEKIDHLVTSGVYSKVRHPIYAADIVLGWGIFFFYPDVRFLIGAHWLMFVLLFWMRREENALIEKFGEEYLKYMRSVPKIFPAIKK